MLKIGILLAVLAIASGFIIKKSTDSLEAYIEQKLLETGQLMEVVQKNHTTKVDHFNLRDNRTFDLRYWENNAYFTGTMKNVILYLCGESTCNYPSSTPYFDTIA